MTGSWEEADKLLQPARDAAEEARLRSLAEEARLAPIRAGSVRYQKQIDKATSQFLKLLWSHKSDTLQALMEHNSTGLPTLETKLGSVSMRLIVEPWAPIPGRTQTRTIGWSPPGLLDIWPSRDCPLTSCRHGFEVFSNGYWEFDHNYDAGNNVGHSTEFNSDVPSAFPPVENGTVGPYVYWWLGAILDAYGLPLPKD